MKKVSKLKIIILFITLGLPVVLTFCLHQGDNHYQQLPVLGPKKVDENGDTTYHSVSHFKLKRLDGKTFSSKEDLEGDFYLIHFFYTNCSDHAPNIFRKLKVIDQKYQDLDNFQMASVTLRPSQDSIKQLKQFKQELDINSEKWQFLTGNKSKIKNLAREELLITVNEQTPKSSEMEHSDLFILVDQKQRIRGYYKASDQEAFKKLKDEILVLKEEL